MKLGLPQRWSQFCLAWKPGGVEHSESSTPTGSKMVGCGSVGFQRGIPADVTFRLAYMGDRVRPNIGQFGGYQGI